MDAYSISVTSLSRRNSSRIYQDLKAARISSIIEIEPGKLNKELTKRSTMDEISKVDLKKPHIGIVGAGLSGLRCADVLLRHGFEVSILEGRDRLGGRVHQAALSNGYLVDLGPNWIHGTKDNPILELARDTNTSVGSWDTRSYVFDQGGELLSVEEGTALSTVMWNIIEDAFAHSNQNCAAIDPKESLMDFFQEKVPEKIAETEKGWKRKREIVLQMAELWGAFVGSPITTQSLKFFWLEECIDGENLFCAGTYREILEKVARPAVDGASIRYQTTVSSIRGKSKSSKGRNVVSTSNGQEFAFDEVVVTAPLGWLKQHLQAFTPPLPVRLCQAIKNIGYGCLEKVYLTFPKAFWLTPEGPDGRIVQGFCQWLSPGYAPDSNSEQWTNEVVELGSVGDGAHPTLLFYTYGDESRYLTSKCRDLPDHDKEAFLFSFFKPYYSRLPSYDESSPDCQPVGSLTTDWLNDDLAGNGSYSNYQVGLDAGDQDIVAMRTGAPDEGIWLAGEHTAPFVALGTATGAYWSGEHTARKIMQKYGKACG